VCAAAKPVEPVSGPVEPVSEPVEQVLGSLPSRRRPLFSPFLHTFSLSLSSISSPADDALSSRSLSPPHLKSFQYPLKYLQNSWRKVVDSILSSSSTSSPLHFRIFVKDFTDRGNFISSLSFDSIYAFLKYLEIIFKELFSLGVGLTLN
jgi:hypothetical protein